MGKKRETGQVPASPKVKARRLTWREERFIWAYIDNEGNAVLAARDAGYAPHTARAHAHEIMRRPHVVEAIDVEKERLRNLINFKRENALKILMGMATARASDFTRVLRNPEDRRSYRGLQEKEFAIESTKCSITNGNEVKLISNSERRAVINELWNKLGLDKDASSEDRLSFLERFARLGSKLGRSSADGGSPSPEGSA